MKNGKPIAIIMFVVVGLIIVAQIQEQNVVALDTSFIKDTKCFNGNECLTIFEIPNQLTEEELAVIDDVAEIFFQDDLPFEFQQEAERQREIEGQRDLLEEQVTSPQVFDAEGNPLLDENGNYVTNPDINTPIENEVDSGIQRVGGTSLGLGSDPSVTGVSLVEKQTTANVFTRGDIVKVVGKIDLIKPSPYFMNINITCCEMDSFRAMSAVETDAVGNFAIKFATTPKFPLGDWKVVISTIGDSNKILKHVYDFKLIDNV